MPRTRFVMPGKQVKDWDRYHALRRKGMSKRQAAAIANAAAKRVNKRKGK